MKVGLFIPCYIDQAYPHVGMATVDVLEKHGVEIVFPKEQTCCGQPAFNSGCFNEAEHLAKKFMKHFKGFEYVVAPSGSCVYMVKEHYERFFKDDPDYKKMQSSIYELTEFLTDVLGVKKVEGAYPHKVGLHQSCHGLRGMGLGTPSELVAKPTSKMQTLLKGLKGIDIVTLSRTDECCGFGGTFSVFEEAVSSAMGVDRLRDHEEAGAEIIASYDVSCLMHLEGIIKRQEKPLRIKHIAEILSEATS